MHLMFRICTFNLRVEANPAPARMKSSSIERIIMRTLNNQEIANVSGGANPIVSLVSGILKGEAKLLTGIFNLLTFGAFKK
jgi:hypothetical protein